MDKLEHAVFDPEEVIETAELAGIEILKIYRKDHIKVEIKSDNSPVTIADQISNDIIVDKLKQLTPEIPIISEEVEANHHASALIMETEEYFWLVDPLDGTKGFINRTDEFCVCIALIHNGKPIAGFIYDPVNATSYFAIEGKGAFSQSEGNRVRINVRKPGDVVSVYMSKNHKGGEVELLDKIWPGCEQHHESSALKFCHLAAGKGDIYLRTKPTSLWDTAAGQAILTAAGGEVFTFDGEVMDYIRDDLINPGFIAAANKKLARELLESLD